MRWRGAERRVEERSEMSEREEEAGDGVGSLREYSNCKGLEEMDMLEKH